MSLTKFKIPAATAQTLTFKRYVSQPRTADGDPVAPSETVLGTKTGCIQPVDADLRESVTGSVENVEPHTHYGFIETRLAGLQTKDIVAAADGKNYVITFVHDFGGSTPQQLDLRIATDQEVVN